MQIELACDTNAIHVNIPNHTPVLGTNYPEPRVSTTQLLGKALESPINSSDLFSLFGKRRPGDVVIVVSDISRPIPYAAILPDLFELIKAAGVKDEEILILIATGMHRPSTRSERLEILGDEIVTHYRIEDHNAEAEDLLALSQKSWAGNVVKLNRRFVEAGFRMITGLVEPHFMAGFSGGRKAVCPGLSSLETVQQFHGYQFLANANATNIRLDDNPCHLEALSVAQAAGVDFSLNIVLDHKRQIVQMFAGELAAAHGAACAFVKQHVSPVADETYDVVLTNSGGYPLDTTFYQCVKGLVCALPVVKSGGTIVTVGGCREGVGSESFVNIMLKYADNCEQFLKDISSTDKVIKDQWQFQMFTRVLKKVGAENIHFYTEAIPQDVLSRLSCNGISTPSIQQAVQSHIDRVVRQGKTICVIPEGPYCAPRSFF
ncbi:nickel-dependent lactate racemase [candidate division KSB1 bacterium]|nr:nickel-dependent lactate racemase [candidate division KSB1 bacterium]